jgi:hypothetical protein
MVNNRRQFIKAAGLTLLAHQGMYIANAFAAPKKKFFQISLAQWSLHRALFSGKLNNMLFPGKAKKDFGIDIVEYVSVFFDNKESDNVYLKELMQRTQDMHVANHLIMVDGEGDLGNPDDKQRLQSVENHYKWIIAAQM